MTISRKIPNRVQQEVLMRSKRRCALCFEEGKDSPQEGMIVRIKHGKSQNQIDNFLFLCANHHAMLDRAGPRDEKHLTAARSALYDAISAEASASPPSAVELREFEERVADLVRAQFAERLGDFFSLGGRTLLRGRSGVSHEVDLAVEFTISGLRFRTVFELKYRRAPVGAQAVLQFAAMSRDIGADKAILVSNFGFSNSAMRLAKNEGIELMRLSPTSNKLEVL